MHDQEAEYFAALIIIKIPQFKNREDVRK